MNFTSNTLELLDILFWSLDRLARPTFRNLTDSFEAWDYRQRYHPRLRNLRQAGFIELQETPIETLVQLTARGRLAVSDGVDPLARWSRTWDGKWRSLLFDLRGRQSRLRVRLWRCLRRQRFGYLQHSAWISPDPVDDATLPLKSLHLTAESFVVIEGHPAPPNRNVDLVEGAWDFVAINRAYQKLIAICSLGRQYHRRADVTPLQRQKWLARQREAWLQAIVLDPFLPESLCPPGYLGREAWKARKEAVAGMMEVERKM
jgi:phenylacetic acid degradation operon negative regulatory protein